MRAKAQASRPTLLRRFGRVVSLAACLAGAGVAWTTAARAEAAPTAQPPFFARRVTGYLTTRDGVQLRYSALLPRASGRFPVIVNYSGYDPGGIGGKAYLEGDTAMTVELDKALVQRGYVVVGVNARGTGCSEGVFDFLGASYGRDGADAIEFIAAQPWSNGAVGMANWSWAGMSQIATASERPAHLKAIAPGMVLGDARLDSWSPGGVTAPGFVAEWWNYLHSRWDTLRRSATAEGDARCLAQMATNLQTSEPHSLSNVILQHPLRDDFIEQRHLAARTHNIAVPVLSLEAFQDEAVTSREGYYQETLRPGQAWMVQSNGPHDLYESIEFRRTLLSFLDRFVKGEPNGFEQTPHLQVWMETSSAGTGDHGQVEQARPRFVITRPILPAPVSYADFALSEQGGLTQSGLAQSRLAQSRLAQGGAGRDAPDAYAYPRASATVDTGEITDAWGQLEAGWREGALAYTSPPLAQDLVAYGSGVADLWVSSSRTDSDLQLDLTEVRPDGQEVFVQRSWLRLSDRAVDASKATPVRAPLLDRPDTTTALTPDQPVLARVEINKLGYAFRKGSRIRLWITTPSDWGGYGFDPVSMPATNRIWHDGAHPSKLVLGVLSDTTVPPERPACGTVMKQPCRADPLAGGLRLGVPATDATP